MLDMARINLALPLQRNILARGDRAQLPLSRKARVADEFLSAEGLSEGAAVTMELPSSNPVTAPEESNSGRAALRPSAERYGLTPGHLVAKLKFGPSPQPAELLI